MAGNNKGSIPVLGGPKSGKKGAAPPTCKLRNSPKLTDIPSLRVRLTNNVEVVLVNVPCNDSGVGLVLHLIATYPDAWGVTRNEQHPHVRFGDIAQIGHPNPNDGWIDTDAAKNEPPSSPGSYRHIQVRTGRYISPPQTSRANAFIHPSARNTAPTAGDAPARPEPKEELVGIVNIPDSEIGRQIMDEIYLNHAGDDMRAYTLFSTDFGHIPVKELAKANSLRK